MHLWQQEMMLTMCSKRFPTPPSIVHFKNFPFATDFCTHCSVPGILTGSTLRWKGALRFVSKVVGMNLDLHCQQSSVVRTDWLLLQFPRQEKYWKRNNIITGFLTFLSIGIYLYSACLKKERGKDLIWLQSANTVPGSYAWLGNKMEKKHTSFQATPFLGLRIRFWFWNSWEG